MIQILLSTYNGEKYLPEQLDSIFSQTFSSFCLLVKDDGSSDATLDILKKYGSKEPRLKLLSGPTKQGAPKSFWALLKASSAPYVMFADQDDVWLPTKTEITLSKMLEEEKKGIGAVLVHTDMQVVEEDKTLRAASFYRYAGLNPPAASVFHRILVQNGVTGCTMMANKALLDKLPTEPLPMVMHDWWLALAASAFGKVVFIDLPTMLYRQHRSNAVGAKSGSFLSLIKKGYKKWMSPDNDLRRTQAEAFYAAYAKELDPDKKRKMELFLESPSLSFLQQKALFLNEGFFWHGFLRNAAKFWLKSPF
jgi:glycosyltransferase involved in cell wall biosynthesis